MSELRDRIARLTPNQRTRLEQRLRERRPGEAELGPRPGGHDLRMSYGQERVWRLSRLMSDSGAYNLHNAHRIRGRLDVEALRAALETVVARNELLRTAFSNVDGQPTTAPPGRYQLDIKDLDGDPDPLAPIARWAERSLDTATPPLFMARLWRLSADEHILSLLAHHLVCDGWSMSLIEQQLSAGYRGVDDAAPPATIAYADFADWEHSREDVLRARLPHWSSVLSGVPPLQLPGERGAQSGEVSLNLSVAISAAVDDAAERWHATPFMVLLAIFAATIHRHTGQEDLVVCTPVAGRPHPALERVVGYFNDIVPVRAQLAPDLDLERLVERYRPTVLAAVEHSVPFQWIAGLPETNTTPLARALFALNDVPASAFELPALIVERLHIPAATSDFELGWFVRSDGQRYRATIRYRSSTAESVERLATDFVSFAAALLAGARLIDLPDHSARDRVPADGATGVASMPRSLLESRLQRIWERIFSRPVGVDDDFFDLGGHSLLAAELIAEVERELSKERIPLATLFGAPTVARFAQLLEEGGWRRSWTSLVPIKPSGTRPPLFFVHAHGGNVIGYSDLARNLSADQPLYGLQAPRADVDGKPRRIEDMARTYIDEIRTIQPEGPYVVGGYCLGGDVAYEMAHQLRQTGANVALVLMVDNPRKEHVQTASNSAIGRMADRVGTRIMIEWTNAAEVPWRDKGRYLASRIARLARRFASRLERVITDGDGRLPFGLHHSRTYRQDELDRIHQKAYEEYQPRPYSGTVAVFRAQRQPLGRTADASLGWSSLVDGELMVYELPGHRIGLFSEPRVKRVVPIMEAAIQKVLRLDGDRGA